MDNYFLDEIVKTLPIFVKIISPSMKKIVFAFVFMVTAAVSSAQLAPSAKVKVAKSSASLNSLSEDQIAELNFRADHLVSVEPAKGSIASDFHFSTVENGKIVTLTDAELNNFNPLLYAIPQDEIICKNLHVQSREGNAYTLVVLSKQQYDQQLKQYMRDINKKK